MKKTIVIIAGLFLILSFYATPSRAANQQQVYKEKQIFTNAPTYTSARYQVRAVSRVMAADYSRRIESIIIMLFKTPVPEEINYPGLILKARPGSKFWNRLQKIQAGEIVYVEIDNSGTIQYIR